MGECNGYGFIFNQILIVQIVDVSLNPGAALITVFRLNFQKLVFNYAHQFSIVCEKGAVIENSFLQFLIFLLDLFTFQTLQTCKTHVQNRLRLNVIQPKALHQALFSVVVRASDNPDDLIDVIDCDTQSFQNVRPCFCLFQVKFCPSGNDFLLELQIFMKNLFQIQGLRLSVNQRDHDCAEVLLKRSMLVQLIQRNLRICVTFQFNDNPHAFTVGLIADLGDSINALILDQLCNTLNQTRLVDHVRDFRNNNL